jgi:serine/threonine protein kinase
MFLTLVVRFKRYFEHRHHLCLVYELLSYNLYELLRNDKFNGVSLGLVRKFAVQILQAMEFLSRQDIQVIVSCHKIPLFIFTYCYLFTEF